MLLNPILIGGGGGGYEIRDCLATAADGNTPLHEFFFQVLCII